MKGRRKIRHIEGNAKCRHLKKLTCKGTLGQAEPNIEGIFLDVIGTKIFKTFAIRYSQDLDLRFLQQQLKVGWGLALFTLSLC